MTVKAMISILKHFRPTAEITILYDGGYGDGTPGIDHMIEENKLFFCIDDNVGIREAVNHYFDKRKQYENKMSKMQNEKDVEK